MKTGRAYGFLDHTQTPKTLIRDLEASREKAGFGNDISFTILANTCDSESVRRALPEKVAQLAREKDVYGSVKSNCTRATFSKLITAKPVKASELRYLVITEIPEITESEDIFPPAQGRANKITAGRLRTILSVVADREYRRGTGAIAKNAVFYMDNRGKAQRY